LFALLELLTVMWSSCHEEDLDEFEWKPSFTSPKGTVKVDLPDNYSFRRGTLELFHEWAKAWVATVMDIAPLDVKGLLQVRLFSYPAPSIKLYLADAKKTRLIWQKTRMTAVMVIFRWAVLLQLTWAH